MRAHDEFYPTTGAPFQHARPAPPRASYRYAATRSLPCRFTALYCRRRCETRADRQNKLFFQLDHDANSRLVVATMTGITPNSMPLPTTFRRAHGRSEVAAPLMLGVHTILGCRRLVHSTSRNGCPEK